MAIPDFQSVMLPLLRQLSDGREYRLKHLIHSVADSMRLTEEERQAVLPSGRTYMYDRVSWAKTYLKEAGLIENLARGLFRISAAGKTVLSQNPNRIDMKFLEQFPSYIDFIDRSRKAKTESSDVAIIPEDASTQTPLESLTESYETIREATKQELLARLKSCSPAFFERTVMKLLLAMGYGGVTGDGQVTGKAGDAGIDGIIREDKLGLDVVCIQAKRWESNTVGRAVVQQFVGSMDFVRAKKGVILTTSTFSKDAISFIDRIEAKKVVLIDGNQLAELMMDHNVGVTTTEVFTLKEVSNDFFDEDEMG